MSAPTVVVTVDEHMPPRMHMVLVEHPGTGVLSAAFRPELDERGRRAAVRALADPDVCARVLAALGEGGGK